MLSREEMSVCLALSLGQAKGVWWGCAGDFHLEPGLSVSPAVRGNARSMQDEIQSGEEAKPAGENKPAEQELRVGCQQPRQP